ncbi:MAG TPA: regulatory protein RecX [Candidatus Omnitrophota bacterium]|nr:regulatory protein RecX [Candidatus Omnitrophota bacterium]
MAKTLAEEQTKQALITALRLLAASPKSDQELRKKLAAKGYPREILERAINELKAQGVLDDRVYAKDLMARLTQGKAAGRYRVAFELKRHGVPQKIREELLDTLTDEAETERALEQARLKWVGWSKLEPQKRKKRLYDFLIRKGYDFQIAQEILQKLAKAPADDGI